ncbi:RNA polymerase sigma factor [Gorillibacterium massiliense]|uniref:RNA polymerase sigma factor n=1 Tax=Gorillibacterium massiliense TaxID=1280390 RepID=UPI0004B84A45|nr:RNA polymerase sigma factor [Gorillibacterium massiliense]
MHQEEEVRLYAIGDRSAFEALAVHWRKPAIRFAMQMTGDYYAAEDLVQDVFAYLYVYPEKYHFRASFQTYLFTLVRNKSIDYLRKNRRMIPDEAVAERLAAVSVEDADDPEWALLHNEQSQELRRYLAMLKSDERTAIYLVDLEGVSGSDAARIMSKNPAAFRVMLHRARKKLKKRYEEEGWGREWERNVGRSEVSG